MLAKIKLRLLTIGSPVWKAMMRLRGIEMGRYCKFIGRPGLNRKRRSRISIGDQVVLCSTGMANPLAETGRCRLATLDPNAQLLIHRRVGMSSTIICCASRIEIGEGTQIGGGTLIIDTDFHPRAADGTWATDPTAVCSPVSIGKHCFIGARSIILKGVTIGDGAVVGAGSVVTKDIPDMAVVAGNPAKVVSSAIG